MQRRAIAAALLLAALSYPALAQSPTDHNVHHPGQDQASSPAQTDSTTGPSAERQGMMRGGMMGMMEGGMKGRGMMGADGMRPMMFRMIFALMDADGDGTVSLQEFQAAHDRIFKAMDSNKDGKLTPEEMLAFLHGTKSPALPQ
jgi:hypothetical protein